jgi:hypothetical protein
MPVERLSATHRGGRERANEPKDTRLLGPPPAYFNENMVGCWIELASMALPGALNASDRGLVESAARLLDEMRQLTEDVILKGGSTVTIRKAVKSGDVTALHRCLSAMGLTPVDRSKISVPSAKAKPSGFSDL